MRIYENNVGRCLFLRGSAYGMRWWRPNVYRRKPTRLRSVSGAGSKYARNVGGSVQSARRASAGQRREKLRRASRQWAASYGVLKLGGLKLMYARLVTYSGYVAAAASSRPAKYVASAR